MPIELYETLGGRVLEIKVSGTLTKADYEKFNPEFDRMVQKHARISLLVEMIDFHGWDLASLWADIKFDYKHYSDIKRIAMVGNKTWEKWMAKVCMPFTGATVKYYELNEVAQARSWVMEGEVFPTPV